MCYNTLRKINVFIPEVGNSVATAVESEWLSVAVWDNADAALTADFKLFNQVVYSDLGHVRF